METEKFDPRGYELVSRTGSKGPMSEVPEGYRRTKVSPVDPFIYVVYTHLGTGDSIFELYKKKADISRIMLEQTETNSRHVNIDEFRDVFGRD
jgi:hypothetical protein